MWTRTKNPSMHHVSSRHRDEPDQASHCGRLSAWPIQKIETIVPFLVSRRDMAFSLVAVPAWMRQHPKASLRPRAAVFVTASLWMVNKPGSARIAILFCMSGREQWLRPHNAAQQ